MTASKAENLFWLGRYTERVFTTLNVFFPFYDRVMDTDVDAFRPFARALDLPEDFADFDAFVNTFLYDKWNRDSVRSAISSAFYNAVVLRPELGSSLLQHIELAMSGIVDAAHHAAGAKDVFDHRDIADEMLAFWGGIENSSVEPTLKALVYLGKYLERIDLYITAFSFEFIKKSGRISCAASIVGEALGIRPVIRLYQGEITIFSKARGNNKTHGINPTKDKTIKNHHGCSRMLVSTSI